MVTFCLGSARQKREYFKNKGMLVLDNVEVLFCASENGKNFFVYGEVPFSEFSVRDYVLYRRALCGGNTDMSLIERAGIPLGKRFGRLCEAERRVVMLAEKTGGEKVGGAAVVNLDGARYSKKNMRALCKLVNECGERVFVCVTDRKFVKKMRLPYEILHFGKDTKRKTRKAFYAAHLLKKRLGATKISVMN